MERSGMSKGEYTWSNGNKYVGDWKDSNMNGFGTKTYKSGKNEKGYWKDNSYICEKNK